MIGVACLLAALGLGLVLTGWTIGGRAYGRIVVRVGWIITGVSIGVIVRRLS